MARNWKILKAAIEQEILFTTKEDFNTYIDRLKKKQEPFQITSKIENEDDSLTVIMRKKYNYQNSFFYKE